MSAKFVCSWLKNVGAVTIASSAAASRSGGACSRSRHPGAADERHRHPEELEVDERAVEGAHEAEVGASSAGSQSGCCSAGYGSLVNTGEIGMAELVQRARPRCPDRPAVRLEERLDREEPGSELPGRRPSPRAARAPGSCRGTAATAAQPAGPAGAGEARTRARRRPGSSAPPSRAARDDERSSRGRRPRSQTSPTAYASGSRARSSRRVRRAAAAAAARRRGEHQPVREHELEDPRGHGSRSLET